MTYRPDAARKEPAAAPQLSGGPAAAQLQRFLALEDILIGFGEGIDGARLEAGLTWAKHGDAQANRDALVQLFASRWIAAQEEGEWAGDAMVEGARDLDELTAVAAALATREEAPAEAGEAIKAILHDVADVEGGVWSFDHDMLIAASNRIAAIIARPRVPDVMHECARILASLQDDEGGRRFPTKEECGFARYVLRAQPPAREDAQPVAKPAPFNPGGSGHAMYQAFNAYLADYVLSTDGDDYVPTPFERDLIEDFFAGLMAEEAFFGPVRALYDAHPAPDALREHERLFKALRDESWDLRCFNIPTGGDDYDIGWRVVGHWQAEPRERTIAEVFSDDPSEAVRQALAALPARDPA